MDGRATPKTTIVDPRRVTVKPLNVENPLWRYAEALGRYGNPDVAHFVRLVLDMERRIAELEAELAKGRVADGSGSG